MKGVLRIAKIVIIFFVSLFVISLAWYAIESLSSSAAERSIPFIDYILYLLGFADLEISDHYLQTGFSTLGLFAVTLLSSVFTVSLFELKSKVQIGTKITVTSPQSALIRISAKKRDAYDLSAVLIAKCGKDISSEEQIFPFLSKGTFQDIRFEIIPGSVVYKYLRAVYLNPSLDPQLILKVAYTDIESGQEYKIAQKYQYLPSKGTRQFVFSEDGGKENNAEFECRIGDIIKSNTFIINLASIAACNDEDIDIIYGYGNHQPVSDKSNAFCANVHMTSRTDYKPTDFVMAYTQDLLDHDWTNFVDLNCALKFDYKVTGDLVVTLELKYSNGTIQKTEAKLRRNDEFETYTLDLHTIDRALLTYVREICFTVFYRDIDANNPTGSFIIKNCVLEVES